MHRHADGSLCLFFFFSFLLNIRRVTGGTCVLKGADAEPSRAFITGAARLRAKNARTHTHTHARMQRNCGDRLHDFAHRQAGLIIFPYNYVCGCEKEKERISGCFMTLDNGHLKCDGRSAAEMSFRDRRLSRDFPEPFCRFKAEMYSACFSLYCISSQVFDAPHVYIYL